MKYRLELYTWIVLHLPVGESTIWVAERTRPNPRDEEGA
jgi:hypothetical protein